MTLMPAMANTSLSYSLLKIDRPSESFSSSSLIFTKRKYSARRISSFVSQSEPLSPSAPSRHSRSERPGNFFSYSERFIFSEMMHHSASDPEQSRLEGSMYTVKG